MRSSGLVLFACAGLLLLMALVSVAMVMLSLGLSSISGLSRALREPAILNNSMLRAMAIDALDPAVRSSFAAMQVEVVSGRYSIILFGSAVTCARALYTAWAACGPRSPSSDTSPTHSLRCHPP
ncbi:hypothetical protein HF086_013680 [Spodoptera exigua]|uniref:Uncharacterized protein n=1 Tax=Spodoptera exigua TaxID=7107 RepID=A0A922MLE9_SPOEX|nr:hypothetical protein HF086_013680 [Spodoptera exigua]